MLNYDFALFETMLVFNDRIFLLSAHLNRLYHSAIRLGFDYKNIETLLLQCSSNSIITNNDKLKDKTENFMSFCSLDSSIGYGNLYINKNFVNIIKDFLSMKIEDNSIYDCESQYDFSLQNKLNLQLDSLYECKTLWSDVAIIKNLVNEVVITNTLKQPANGIKEQKHKYQALNISQNYNVSNNICQDMGHDNMVYNIGQNYIMRLILQHDGKMLYTISPLDKITNYDVLLSNNILNSEYILHRHKATKREHFIDATQAIANNLCFDCIYLNEIGEITEGSRSNIIVRHGKKYYTPHSSSGLLCGTFRSLLLSNNICQERILYKEDIQNADSVYCINSVRGIVRARLMNFDY
ncbi:hypothetical protein LS73_009325 [Helicobacter muridarum]|uniref:Para-aminobenzoate synthase glutamine amidotransferase component I n=1 Tax=Helicobacter muridarum TaxID=216 RepID=A0A099U2W9_9HELI|nr:aminotransferase class IV [Helicobacter muridarum]TLD98158.1 hypothetical protein LS73_009325 [Helicobacter muridarum]STQ86488.1 para-aminobenzoate synthase glutamine amidotransferase component I [Helicobacter muridarum]